MRPPIYASLRSPILIDRRATSTLRDALNADLGMGQCVASCSS